jgi:hypothetical protein
MFESIGDQAVIAPEFIRVNETTPFHFLDGQLEKGFTLDIPDNLDSNLSTSFQDAEYRNLACSTPLETLVLKANKWGKINGWPLYEKYPEYEEIRSIGKSLNEIGGIELMRLAYSAVHENIPYPGMSEYWWDNIGDWEA